MSNYLVQAYRLANIEVSKFSDQLHRLGWVQQEKENTPLYQSYKAAVHVASTINCALVEAKQSYLSTLPPLPKGYYLATCVDPENGCFGWHVYRFGEGGPTGEFYCSGGDGEHTQAWLDGTLVPFDSLEES